jgi:hypothetical protein
VHTAPHHDDIMLSYHPAMHSMLGRPDDDSLDCSSTAVLVLGEQKHGNTNFFSYLTSGFHSVNDAFIQAQLTALGGADADYAPLLRLLQEGQTGKLYDDLMTEFYLSFIHKNFEQQESIEHVIFIRKVAEVWNLSTPLSPDTLVETLDWIRMEYLSKHSPGM